MVDDKFWLRACLVCWNQIWGILVCLQRKKVLSLFLLLVLGPHTSISELRGCLIGRKSKIKKWRSKHHLKRWCAYQLQEDKKRAVGNDNLTPNKVTTASPNYQIQPDHCSYSSYLNSNIIKIGNTTISFLGSPRSLHESVDKEPVRRTG